MERYIGLDPHGTSCTFGVIGPSGRKLRHDVVAGISENRGQKSDVLDAFRRAEELRTGTIKTPVFKAPRQYSRLRELARVHSMLVRDVVRVQARLKVMYRARGIATPGKSVYNPMGRVQWLNRLPVSCRWATEKLHEEYDHLLEIKRGAEREPVAEARKHPISRVLATEPGLGPIRVAQLLPIVVTPHRFRTRSQFWAYGGLGIVMRSSSDWVQTPTGGWVRAQVQQTRGLNRSKRSNNSVVDNPIKIRPHRIVREAFFPQPRRQRSNVTGGMMLHAL